MRRVLSALGVGAFGALPLALPAFVSPQLAPPLLAYLLTDGRDLIGFSALLGAGAVLVAHAARPPTLAELRSRLEAASERVFFGAALGVGFLLALGSMPGWRSTATEFGGDEPKYLRMADSLARDLDVDVASTSQLPPSLSRTLGNARRLLRSTGDAVAGLFDPATPDGHRWSLGNWTVAGAHGGHYYVQSPGLPILLFPATLARAILFPDRPDVLLSLATLALFLGFGFAQTLLLASALAGDRTSGLLVTVPAFASAPLLIGGFHFYPESAALALVPWILRHALADRPPPALVSAALGIGLGFLPWLHPKYLPLAAVLAGLLALRLRGSRRLAVAAAGALVLLFALALYDHRVTGLFTPDALYRRFGSEIYRGPQSLFSSRLLNGLVTAFFGARDGIFVMAPWLAGAALSVFAALRRDRRRSLALLAAVASLALAAAAHGGGAPGPPGRLMTPVAPALVGLIAIGLPRLRASLAFCLTIALLAVVSLSITLGMHDEQRRTVNPYRDVFSDLASDFARDLPEGPGRPQAAAGVHASRDLLRGALLAGGLLFWAWRFDRAGSPMPPERAAIVWLLGLWCSVAVSGWGLSALGP